MPASTLFRRVIAHASLSCCCCRCCVVMLQLLKQDNLYRFPYFTTFSLDFSNAATNMLSQHCSAVLLAPEVRAEIVKLVDLAEQVDKA